MDKSVLESALNWLNRQSDLRYGFCRCGCGCETTIPRWTDNSRGWIAGTPLEYVRGHQNRILISVHVNQDGIGCWVWLKGIRPDGYGQWMTCQNDRRKIKRAHRVVWEWVNGPIPDGLFLDHLCRNRACVNPAHLRIVTNTENVRCGDTPRLDAAKVKQIKILHKEGESAQLIANKFGVDKSTIRGVLIGRTWKDIQ